MSKGSLWEKQKENEAREREEDVKSLQLFTREHLKAVRLYGEMFIQAARVLCALGQDKRAEIPERLMLQLDELEISKTESIIFDVENGEDEEKLGVSVVQGIQWSMRHDDSVLIGLNGLSDQKWVGNAAQMEEEDHSFKILLEKIQREKRVEERGKRRFKKSVFKKRDLSPKVKCTIF